eukprot:367006_1
MSEHSRSEDDPDVMQMYKQPQMQANITPKPPDEPHQPGTMEMQSMNVQISSINNNAISYPLHSIASTSPLSASGEDNIFTVSQTKEKKRSVPRIAYKILLHILLLYAVVGVTYLFFTKNDNCSCLNQNVSAAKHREEIITTETPIFGETGNPTSEPTFSPSKHPTFSPSKHPTIKPSKFPTISPTNIPTFPPTPSPTITISSDDILPINSIVIWSNCSAENIPIGWNMCDGSNGTPDLKGRFVMGSYDINYFGGNSGGTVQHNHIITTSGTVQSHILNINEIPSHNHWNGEYKYALRVTGCGTEEGTDCNGPPLAPDLQYTGTLSNNGGGQAHNHGFSVVSSSRNTNHLPPYYVLCYIMKKDVQIWVD